MNLIGQRARAVEVAKQALMAAEKVDNKQEKAAALNTLAHALIFVDNKGITSQLFEMAKTIDPDEKHRATILKDIAQALARMGELDENLSIIRGLGGNWNKANAMNIMALTFVQAGHNDRAIKIIHQVLAASNAMQADLKANLLSGVAFVLATLQHYDEATELVNQAFAVMDLVEEQRSLKSITLREIAQTLAVMKKKNGFDRLLKVIESVSFDEWIKFALIEIIGSLIKLGELDRAIALANTISRDEVFEGAIRA